jgi:glycosyltransferase involved in cell wall biosynthesis
MKKTEGVSIIICCFNGALRLPETLRRLSEQVVNGVQWEVILVNNNSSDNTVDVAREVWSKNKCTTPFIIIDEPEQGKSKALKKGIGLSKYDYFIVCDDDNWLAPSYVQTAFEVMQSNNSIGILGGDSDGEFEISPPEWFEANKCDYAVGKQGEQSGDATARWFLWGAGAILRKEVYNYFINSGMYNFLGGRKGNEDLTPGEDTEICKWYILAGYKLWYDNRLVIKHYIPAVRLTESYFKRMWVGFENTDYWLGRYDILIHIKNEHNSRIKNFLRGLKYLLLRRKNVFVIKKIDHTRTYIQCLIGPVFKLSTKDEFRLIKKMYPFLYKDLFQLQQEQV